MSIVPDRWPRSVMVAIPCYNCERQIPRVLDSLARFRSAIAEVMVIDNRSSDETVRVAVEALEHWEGGTARMVVRNDANYGLGGSHKVAFERAIAKGHDAVVILHGDDQGDPADLLRYWREAQPVDDDAVLGARFMAGSSLEGYSLLRTLGNRVFNGVFSILLLRPLSDLGSGLNFYRVPILLDRFFLRFPDDLTFNYCMVMAHVALGHRIRFFPISWREEDQVSNVKLVSQARRVLALLLRFRLRPRAFLRSELRAAPREVYPCTVVYSNEP